MKLILEFHGSCGHTTSEEIAQSLFDDFVSKGNEVQETPESRTVIVHPWRYCVCSVCMEDMDK